MVDRLGVAAAELYRMVSGRELDDAERQGLVAMLARRDDGTWVSPTYHLMFFGAVVSPLLEARALAGLFLLDETVIWSARTGEALAAAFDRLRGLIEGAESLRLQARRVIATQGGQRIELRDGRRLLFIAGRTAIRGLSADCVLMDGHDAIEAVSPSLASRANAQLVVEARA